ncbi:MAG TPA: inorganic diphosphatase [Candidatus Scatovivens faecipullorum]|nr:inorganic diphosphatase [Candidatus Scatovivens faecipullorum]
MKNLEYLNKILEAKIDRPIGSSHPKYPDHIYLVNYGYIPNTVSGDGKELDCYVLGEYKPLSEFKGKCIAIIHRLNDDDDKLILTPENRNFTNAEIRLLTDFQERFYKSEIIRNSNFIDSNKNISELCNTNLEINIDIVKSDNKDYQLKIFEDITKFNNQKNPNLTNTNAWNYGDLFGFYAKNNEEIIAGIVVYEKMQWIEVDTLFVDEKYRNQKLRN